MSQRNVGHWYAKALEHISFLHQSQEKEIAEARDRGDIICTKMSGNALNGPFPQVLDNTPYAVFFRATEEIKAVFITEVPTDEVIYEVALGMMDNGNFVWR